MVIDHFSQDSNQKNDAVAYVYIKGEDTTLRNSPDRIVSMLIKQLCWKLETLPDQTLDYYRQCKKDARLPVLDKLAAMFMECAGSLGRAVVVIDGLDECEEKCRKPLLNFVVATGQQSNSKVLVTSRWEWDIERAFCRIKSLIIPDLSSDQKDIAKVVEYRVAKELGRFSLETQEYIIQQLVEKSNGM
jgi:Cdc6-like AAA superfamily ATPase